MAEIEVKPEHAADPSSRRVGMMVGVIGVILSIVTIASHRTHTRAVIHRTEANDAWAYYQAKKIREYTSDVGLTLLRSLGTDASKTAPAAEKLEAARQKYASDAEKVQEDAHGKDSETDVEEHRALWFDVGEGFLELGLVLCSLYFMARNNLFPIIGVLSSGLGIGLAIWGWLL
jgi:Domain of unknown function (DUF4337)